MKEKAGKSHKSEKKSNGKKVTVPGNKSKRKKSAKEFILPETDPELQLSPEAKAEIEAIIDESIQRFTVKHHKTVVKEFQALELKVTEFLDDFIIIGHDLTGNRIVMVHAPTQLTHDALLEHIRGTFLKIISQHPPY